MSPAFAVARPVAARSARLRSAVRPHRRYFLRWLFVAYGILVAIPFLVFLVLFFLRASTLEPEVFE